MSSSHTEASSSAGSRPPNDDLLQSGIFATYNAIPRRPPAHYVVCNSPHALTRMWLSYSCTSSCIQVIQQVEGSYLNIWAFEHDRSLDTLCSQKEHKSSGLW